MMYEFICNDCGHEFEELIRPCQADRLACPQCGSNQINRLISAVKRHSSGGATTSASEAGACGPSGFS